MRFQAIPIHDLSHDIVKAWQVLQAADAELASPFFAPGFSRAVGQVRNDLHVGLIEDGGTITGILPFHRKPGRCGVPVGGQLNDYQGIIGAAPGSNDVGGMLRGFDLAAYDFNHGLAGQGLFAENAFSFSSSPRADLRQGYDAWAQAVSERSKALKTLARKERKLEREMGALHFQANDSSADAWEKMVEWKDKALREQGAGGFLNAGWINDLIDRLRHAQDPDCAGRFSTLYAGDRLVAVHFGLCTPRAWHWWFPSYDPTLGNYSAGLILMRHCIEAAAQQGMAELDFGRGTQRYKLEFSNAARDLCEGSLERGARPFGAVRRVRKAVQGMANARLPARHSDLLRRAGTKVLRSGLL